MKYLLLTLTPLLLGFEGQAQDTCEVLNLHYLITGYSPTDGSSVEGSNTYLWNWVDPNPREELKLISGESLSSLKGPRGYEKYLSWANIDLRPYTYWEYVLGEPRFLFRGDTINSWSWCSEREAAFTAALTLMGYEAKVILAGGHTWTEVTIKGKLYRVDNTFNEFITIDSSTFEKNIYHDLSQRYLDRTRKILTKNHLITN